LDDGSIVRGYEIHHGRVHVEGDSLFGDGCSSGAVVGTLWHGLFENDGWRRAYLTDVARLANKRFIADTEHNFASRREARLETLADLIDEHLDTAALLSLLTESSASLPTILLSRQ
jgi:adenosylcobyric acid synthase